MSDQVTVVLVHGAFAESSSWNDVISRLSAEGVRSVALANPLRSQRTDSRYLAEVLQGIDGPVVIAAHSYGGMLSTEMTASSNVGALVYVAAFAPDHGETALDLTGKFPGSSLGDTISNTPLADGVADILIDQDKYHQQFMADVAEDEALRAAVTQRAITDKALGEGLSSEVPAWKTVPSWFIFGELDRNIPVAAHRFMAERAGARDTIEIPGASHSVAVSQPDSVTQVILSAVQSLQEG